MIANSMIVLLALLLLYFGVRAVRAIHLYLEIREPRLVTCPETREVEIIELAAGAMAVEVIMGEPQLRIAKCSRWPMRANCGQNCLAQVERRPEGIPFCAAVSPHQ